MGGGRVGGGRYASARRDSPVKLGGSCTCKSVIMSPGTCAGIAWVNTGQYRCQSPSRGRGGNGASAGGSEGYVPVEAAGATSSDINARSKAEKNGDDSMATLNEWRSSFLFLFRCCAVDSAE